MRTAWLVAFVTLPLVACASGLDFGPPAGHSGTEAGGGTLPTDDAGNVPYNSDTGTGTTNDAAPSSDTGSGTLPDGGGGSTDAGAPDTGTVDGAGKDSAADAPFSDAGPIVLGESCTSPIDISTGGTFAIDTCTLTDSVAASCGTTAAAAILAGVAPIAGSTYQITFPSGWVLEELDDTCSPMLDSCGSTGTWSVSGETPGGFWYFAIEPESGTCGSTTVTVDRLM